MLYSYNDVLKIDPPGRPTVTAGRDHCFCTCRLSVATFQNLAKQSENNVCYWQDCGLAEWIIDDTCLVEICFY